MESYDFIYAPLLGTIYYFDIFFWSQHKNVLMLQATILEIFAELCHKNVYLFILNTATATYHNFYTIQQNKEMNEENLRFLT